MVDYFKIFSITQQFNIDKDLLEKSYFQFQSQFHPDANNASNIIDANINDIEKSIAINEGYKVLSDDFLRACHLIELQGIDILKDEKAIKVNQATLIEILEIQEQIALEKDLQNIDNKISFISNKINSLILQSMETMKEKVNKAAQILVRAKYFKKCLIDLKNRKKELKNAV